MKRLYIAGPVTGVENYADAFDAATAGQPSHEEQHERGTPAER